MKRLYFLLSTLALASLLAACAAGANRQADEIKFVDNISAPTGAPEQTKPVESLKSNPLPAGPPASCPITQAPEIPFIPPEVYPSKPPERYANQFWYGTPELWTMLSTDATWNGLPHDKYGYSEKVFWWSQGFHVSTDPSPAFTVTIERLDATTPASPAVVADEATNASADFGTAMLTGVTVPEAGCWEITGQYKEAKLSFVVWVAP